MEISFKNAKLQKKCNDFKKASKEWGEPMAKKIRQRLDELEAAPNLEAMRYLPGRCHELKGNRKNQLSIDLVAQWRLLFKPSDKDVILKNDGGMDWNAVKKITILGVEDTHE